MKKIVLFVLSAIMLLSITACSNNTELEQLRKENKELKQQLSELKEDSQASDSKTAENITPPQGATISFSYVDTTLFPDCLTDGIYRCGTDFAPGDYYILSLYSDNASYDVSDSPNDFSNFQSRIIRKIHAENGQYVKLDAALLIDGKQFNTDNWKTYGAFLVGKDIPAGEYKIEPIQDEYKNDTYGISVKGNLAAYQITLESPVGDIIESAFLHEKQSYITVEEGQYLMINNSALTLTK